MKKLVIAVFLLAMFIGCNSEPQKPVEPEKPKAADLLAGRSAFQKMFIQARHWATDAQPYILQSQTNSDSKGHELVNGKQAGGKSAMWRSGFASPGQMRATKPFMWSGTDAPGAPSRGVSFGTEDTYSPTNTNTRIFDTNYLKVDSDQAFDVAQKHGGDKILEKNPDQPVIYILDFNRSNELIWHVIYGADRDTAKLRVAVNATTGEYMHVEK